VTLDFDLEPAGAISAKLTLNEEEISTAFLAQRLESVALVEQHLPRLNAAFIRAGLKVGSLSARQELAPKRPEQQLAPLTLLDEKA
jgi:flagellar hook-length control protein FliK